MRPEGERIGEIVAKEAVQLLFSTGKSFKVDGVREKLREFFLPELCRCARLDLHDAKNTA
jgi:hypothetical protein